MPSTFHGATIGNHDFEIIENMGVAMHFFGNATMNKIMDASTFSHNDDLLMLDVTD
jgi:hypothetical protein